MIAINGLDILIGVGAVVVLYLAPLAFLQRRIDKEGPPTPFRT